jgi:tetratricopeptide (TPR) repeat protein
MIVKNEEACLPTCLASVADLVDEIIIVDTGSTDRTKEIAAGFGARTFDFAWVDDFSAARNESVRRATGDWIFYLDADEYLDEANREKFRALLNGLRDENGAFVLTQRSKLPKHRGPDALIDQVRIFRNRPDHRWQYPVHEQILPALESTASAIHGTDIAIGHSGYQNPDFTRGKLERNLALLQRDHNDRPHDPYVLFNLGWTYLDLGQAVEALPLLRDSQQRTESGTNYLPVLYDLQIHCLEQLGQWDEAFSVCRAGRALFPEDPALHFREGMLRRQRGDPSGAEACFRQLLTPALSSTSPDSPLVTTRRSICRFDGLQGYLARHQLAQVFSDQGRLAEAETEWRAALAEASAFTPAEIELIKLFLAQEGREDEAEKALRNVLQREPDQLDCWCNLARLLRNQDRHADVFEVCRNARKIFPDDPELLRLQGLACYELNNLAEAEACLLGWLEKRDKVDSSGNQEYEKLALVRQVLADIYDQQGRPADAPGKKVTK